MGASGWEYFVPYQTDISKALQELREAVFRQGDYHKRPAYWRDITFEEYLWPDPDRTEEDKAYYLAEFQRLQALPDPTSIEALRNWNAEDGTHSILDIDEVAPTASIGAVAPVPNEELERFFGTDKPTREMIERKQRDMFTFLQQGLGRYREEGTYIVVYRNGEPDEIYFTGYSGD